MIKALDLDFFCIEFFEGDKLPGDGLTFEDPPEFVLEEPSGFVVKESPGPVLDGRNESISLRIKKNMKVFTIDRFLYLFFIIYKPVSEHLTHNFHYHHEVWKLYLLDHIQLLILV